MKKYFTVAILGTGARGAEAYGRLIQQKPDCFRIVALCDKNIEKLKYYKEVFQVEENNCFLSEEEFFEKKRADLLVIATPDSYHIQHALQALSVDYNILLEKPITDKKEECKAILEAYKKANSRVMVCHVLRYAPAFLKVKEMIDNGKIGKLISFEGIEQVGYAHQAHSYVRGNWRKREDCTPMILAKCCHDLDLFQYYADSPCKSISSIGNLAFFKKENMPKDASARCMECKYIDSCPYSAKHIYIKQWNDFGMPENAWPFNVLAPAPTTEEKLYDAITSSPYGRCVFACDNNVVDHQITQMTF